MFSRLMAALFAVTPFVGLAAGGGAVVYALVSPSAIGPGYLEGIEDISCPDAGALISTNNGTMSLSCECDAATYFDDSATVPLTGRAETNFDGNVRQMYCRSQANTTCDCWALVATDPGS